MNSMVVFGGLGGRFRPRAEWKGLVAPLSRNPVGVSPAEGRMPSRQPARRRRYMSSWHVQRAQGNIERFDRFGVLTCFLFCAA